MAAAILNPSQKTERIPVSHALVGIVSVDAERMSGIPCFAGTRVPIQHLWDYLEGGEPLADFLDGFEGVTEAQAKAVLRSALERLLEELLHNSHEEFKSVAQSFLLKNEDCISS